MRLVGTAAFKAVEGSYQRSLVGSIPIHSRFFLLSPGRDDALLVLKSAAGSREISMHSPGARPTLKVGLRAPALG